MQAFLPRWSPDGSEIVFSAKLPDAFWNIDVISSEGGTPERILPSEHNQMDANWSPDGNSLVFGINDDLSSAHLHHRPENEARFRVTWIDWAFFLSLVA